MRGPRARRRRRGYRRRPVLLINRRRRRGSTTGTRPRVAVLGHVARLSGAELAMARTLPALAEDVDLVVVLAESGPLVQRLEGDSIRVVVVPLDAAARDLSRTRALSPAALRQAAVLVRYVGTLRRFLRAQDIDLVHTNTLKAALYGGVAGRLAGVPVVWHIRDRIADDYLPRPAVAMVRALSLVLPTAVIANSRATASTLPRSRHAQLTGSPVVPDPVRNESPGGVSASGPPVIGLIGRISPWKGQDLFLRAFAEAFAARPDVRARLIGSAMFGEHDYEQSLHLLASELGVEDRVEFRGFREDVGAELAALTVAVHCSTVAEPFGQVVLEAMAAGVPVIAAGEGGPSEVVTHGHDGLLTNPRDPHALSRAMRELVDDAALRERLVAGGLSTAQGYTPERTAAAIAKVYAAVLRR